MRPGRKSPPTTASPAERTKQSDRRNLTLKAEQALSRLWRESELQVNFSRAGLADATHDQRLCGVLCDGPLRLDHVMTPSSPSPAQRGSRRTGEDRILSLPNVVTTPRLVLVPWFVWLLLQPHHRDWFAAAVLLAALGTTDWLDGQLARRLDQVTKLGKVLDPVADRVLLATAVIGILAVGAVPVPIAVIAMAREGLVAVSTVALAMAGARRIDVTWSAKQGPSG